MALVGHTGSGKAQSLTSSCDSMNLSEEKFLLMEGRLKTIRKKKSGQKLDLFAGPIFVFGNVKDNIRLYNKYLTDEQVIEAARFVQAHTFIEKLENGYEHEVVERGATFSSGQRQLIAFARTIATNPKILVLDEATANIDTETEEAIQTALEKMRKGRTTIAIAHRLSTIQDADLILVLHQGEIVERGTHQQLLARRGLYHKMYLLQNGLVDHLEDAVN